MNALQVRVGQLGAREKTREVEERLEEKKHRERRSLRISGKRAVQMGRGEDDFWDDIDQREDSPEGSGKARVTGRSLRGVRRAALKAGVGMVLEKVGVVQVAVLDQNEVPALDQRRETARVDRVRGRAQEREQSPGPGQDRARVRAGLGRD